MTEIYLGYYKDTLLAVSTDKKKIKKYLKEVRNLSEYDIDDNIMEWENAEALYSEVILEEYLKDLYLPRKDCTLLDKEVRLELDKFVDTLVSMRYYYNKILYIDIMEKHANQLKETIHNMETDLTTKKILKKIRKRIIKSSSIFSSNIDEYLHQLKIKKYNDELDSLYHYKLYEED